MNDLKLARGCKCRFCQKARAARKLEVELMDLPSLVPERVAWALAALDRVANRVIATSRQSALRGFALRRKTKALIRHDRILRGEV